MSHGESAAGTREETLSSLAEGAPGEDYPGDQATPGDLAGETGEADLEDSGDAGDQATPGDLAGEADLEDPADAGDQATPADEADEAIWKTPRTPGIPPLTAARPTGRPGPTVP